MRGATILKTTDDKTRQLNKHTLLAFSGEAGDTVQFAEFIQANIALYSMRNETELGPSAVASFVRGELARSLRSRKPYNVNLLLGGVDPITKEPSLYWLDYLASSAKLPYAAHGYAQYVIPDLVKACPFSSGSMVLTMPQVLLPLYPRQAPPPRHLLRTRHEDPAHVHGRAAASAAH